MLHRFDRSAPPRRPLPLVAAVLLLAAAACGGGTDGVTDPGAVASIQFAADADTVVAGSSVSLSGLLRDTQGNQVTATTVSWSSTNASVATVSSVGLAQGLEPGVTTIRAASGASQATLRLVVEAYVPPPPGQPSAVAPPPLASSGGDGNFTIRVVWPDGADARASALVDAAIARWRRVVVGDLPNATFDIAADACFEGQKASRETVDDLLIFVRVEEIDGPSGTLARAGPCLVRANRGLPLVGLVEVDEADVGRDAALVTTMLTHEIGHVLGIGTLWDRAGLLHGRDSDNPLFLGATAQEAYAAIGGGTSLVYVENTGGEGTKNGHWRETTYRSELMTGWIGANANPLSAITVGSLRDLGYAVSASGADSYVLPSANVASPSVAGGGVRLQDELIAPRFTVDADGRTRPIGDR